MAAYIEVTDASFQADVLDSELPVLVDFWAPWCGPCKAIAPHLETLAQEFAGRLTVAKVNVDHHNRYAGQFGIRGIPALLLFKNGELIDQLNGMPPNPMPRLRQMANNAL